MDGSAPCRGGGRIHFQNTVNTEYAANFWKVRLEVVTAIFAVISLTLSNGRFLMNLPQGRPRKTLTIKEKNNCLQHQFSFKQYLLKIFTKITFNNNIYIHITLHIIPCLIFVTVCRCAEEGAIVHLRMLS